MQEKIQQLITELETEIAAFDEETRKRLEELENLYDERKAELEAYLVEKGMNPAWTVVAVLGSWHFNVCLNTADVFNLARISINRKGIMKAQLEDCSPYTKFSNIDATMYEHICGDFTAAVNLFNNFDYEALDKKVRELELDEADKLQDKLNITHELQKYLEYFKDCITEEKKCK